MALILGPTPRRQTDATEALTDDPKPQYVVQRREDGKFLGLDGKPTSDISGAEAHDSRAIAGLWADRATREKPGTWEAVPHPGPDDDDDPFDQTRADESYSRLARKAA